MKTKKLAPEGQNSPMRQTAQGVDCDAGFAFVVVRTRYIGIREVFRTRIGPLNIPDANRLAEFLGSDEAVEAVNYRPQVLRRTTAEPAEKGWGSSDFPKWIQRIFNAENARIREANERS
jgi:hypothetical protein